jgi:hypothetical protein
VFSIITKHYHKYSTVSSTLSFTISSSSPTFARMSFAPKSSSSDEPPTKVQKCGDEEYFPLVPKITYAGPDSLNPLSYRYYNPEETILGKPMKEWLRFSVCFWHTVSSVQ